MLLMKDVEDGRFSVKFFYIHFASARDSLFPSHFVWNPWVPTKLASFLGKLRRAK